VTVAERLDAYLACGLDLYLDADDRLRVRGPATLRDAARPSICRQKAAIVAHLLDLRPSQRPAAAGAVGSDRSLGRAADHESAVRPQLVMMLRVGNGVCP
jgi:hypothetical protein